MVQCFASMDVHRIIKINTYNPKSLYLHICSPFSWSNKSWCILYTNIKYYYIIKNIIEILSASQIYFVLEGSRYIFNGRAIKLERGGGNGINVRPLKKGTFFTALYVTHFVWCCRHATKIINSHLKVETISKLKVNSQMLQ